MAVKETSLLEASTGWVIKDGRDIDDAEATSVVGLVTKTINDVLIVVDRFSWGLVITGVFWFLKRADVENVSGGVVVGSFTRLIDLVEFVVQEEVSHVLRIGEPALVGVCGAVIGDVREDGGLTLIGDIHDDHAILIVVEADLLADILLIGSLVDNTLGYRREKGN